MKTLTMTTATKTMAMTMIFFDTALKITPTFFLGLTIGIANNTNTKDDREKEERRWGRSSTICTTVGIETNS